MLAVLVLVLVLVLLVAALFLVVLWSLSLLLVAVAVVPALVSSSPLLTLKISVKHGDTLAVPPVATAPPKPASTWGTPTLPPDWSDLVERGDCNPQTKSDEDVESKRGEGGLAVSLLLPTMLATHNPIDAETVHSPLSILGLLLACESPMRASMFSPHCNIDPPVFSAHGSMLVYPCFVFCSWTQHVEPCHPPATSA